MGKRVHVPRKLKKHFELPQNNWPTHVVGAHNPDGRPTLRSNFCYYRTLTETKETFNDVLNEGIAYFEQIEKGSKPPTLNGLARWLGLPTEELNPNRPVDMFTPLFTRFHQLISEAAEERLYTKAYQGAAFVLKNLQGDLWIDKQVIQQDSVEEGHIDPQLLRILEDPRFAQLSISEIMSLKLSPPLTDFEEVEDTNSSPEKTGGEVE